MSHNPKILKTAAAVICMISMLLFSTNGTMPVYASNDYAFVVLTKYAKTMNIGDEYHLIAVTSNGKKPSFSSSSSAIASVNTYGKITAKKAGTATITAKIKNGEASCKITVKKTTIELSEKSISLEPGYSKQLKASASTGHPVKFKSSKSSIASVDEDGMILAKKPGTATITVTCDKSSVSCKVTVKLPTVRLKRTSLSLYRKESAKLTVTSTSKNAPKWKTSKKSVATVDSTGTVTAVKNGTAVITVTIDGVSKTCQVTVRKPKIKFSKESVTLAAGETFQAKATVSSGNAPEYSSSNTTIATVNQNGNICAKAPGKAYIYAKEDGAKERMTVIVTAE